MLQRCVGPNRALADIRDERQMLAQVIRHDLKLTEQDIVLDLGSGLGMIARPLADHVKHIHCADISKDFLAVCQTEVQPYRNVDCHLIPYGDLTALYDRGITAIYASAVFIHFNIYDICIYLREFFNLLPDAGRVWFDYKEASNLSFDDALFSRHLHLYHQDRQRIVRLVNYHCAATIINIAQQIGFEAQQHENIFMLNKCSSI